MEENLEMLATVETWDNGKSIRETMAADLPLAIDHFRYFAGVIRAEAGEVSNLDANTVSMEVHEPLGVVGQIIPWNFPIDHSLELPDIDGDMEAGTRIGRRQLRGPEAG
jgi:aldehyde dehydrogenase